MIVDDDIALGRSMSLVLRRKGYSVATAKDGPAAIAMLTERSFDTVFMDIKMPSMDGVETYRGIKQIRPDAVVVMMTAYALDDMVNDALLEGAYGVLYKPLDIDRMIAVIERAQ